MPTLVVHRTIDAGKNWTQADLPLSEDWERKAESRITFLDERHGWVLVTEEEQLLSPKKSHSLTVDGGAIWSPARQAAKSGNSLKGANLDGRILLRSNGGVGLETGLLTFVDCDYGFCLKQPGHSSADRRRRQNLAEDGVKTWQETVVFLAGAALSLHFISPEMGWLASESSLVGVSHGGNAFKTYWDRTEN